MPFCTHCGEPITEWRSKSVKRPYCSMQCRDDRMRAESVPVEDRFWTKVQKSDGCWIWTAQIAPSGYGMFTPWPRKESPWRAHRYAWMLTHGAIPEGLCVLHKCDNPPCVNPDHLFLGTDLDNMRDRNAKGRANMPHGDKHWKVKIPVAMLPQIKLWYSEGIKQKTIAATLGVHQTVISRIITGQRRRVSL